MKAIPSAWRSPWADTRGYLLFSHALTWPGSQRKAGFTAFKSSTDLARHQGILHLFNTLKFRVKNKNHHCGRWLGNNLCTALLSLLNILLLAEFLWALFEALFFIFRTNELGLHFQRVNLHFYGAEAILHASGPSANGALVTF